MNWGIFRDGSNSCIHETNDLVDGEEVFATYSQARAELLNMLRNIRCHASESIQQVLSMKKADWQ